MLYRARTDFTSFEEEVAYMKSWYRTRWELLKQGDIPLPVPVPAAPAPAASAPPSEAAAPSAGSSEAGAASAG
jgi:hypothetical protein